MKVCKMMFISFLGGFHVSMLIFRGVYTYYGHTHPLYIYILYEVH